MEQWLPLFKIFLNSSAPEGEASLWFQNAHHHRSTTSFLSLLLTPTPHQHSTDAFFFDTLPHFAQYRILSFLAADHRRFSPHLLRSLAAHILQSFPPASFGYPTFWVLRAARNLLDVVPLHVSDASEPPHDVPLLEDDEFNAPPDWLRAHAASSGPLLPWLPLSPHQFRQRNAPFHPKGQVGDTEATEPMVVERSQEYPIDPSSAALGATVLEKASALKAEIATIESAPEATRIAGEIRKLCKDHGAKNQLSVLGLIEAWEAKDEIISVLLSNLCSENDPCANGWSTLVLCSVILPKFLSLNSPVSRVVSSVTIDFCKLYSSAAVDALIFPLALRKEGLSVVLCDVLSRIIKECLHPSHVSAFCQRLLCGEGKARDCICLPCHQDLLSNDLVWTESLFMLFQRILNQDVQLTPDTMDKLVSVITEKAVEFSKSLKFGNFLLCFMVKCGHVSKLHKVSLEQAAERTDTFVTKSILSKLSGL